MIQMPVGIQLSDEPIPDDDTAREQAIADFTEQFPDAADGVFLYLDLTEPEPGQTYNSHDYFLTYGAAQLYYTSAKWNKPPRCGEWSCSALHWKKPIRRVFQTDTMYRTATRGNISMNPMGKLAGMIPCRKNKEQISKKEHLSFFRKVLFFYEQK